MNIPIMAHLAINLFLLSASVLLLFISLILWILRLSPVRRLAFLSLAIFSCSLWVLFHNPLLGMAVGDRPILESVDVLCQYGITFFSLTYVREFVNGWRKNVLRACQIWTLLFVAVTSLLHMATELTYTDSLRVGAICNIVFIILIGICIVWEAFWEENRDTRRLLLSAVPALTGGLLEIAHFLRSGITSTTIFFSVGFLLFMFLQVFWFIRYLQEQAQRSAKMKQELLDARIAILFSQIQPHFLYNSLLGIKLLCDIDPPRASEALEHFSFYLRGNLDSLVNRQLVPFKKELVHSKDYLFLEKMRFDKRLNIEWSLEFEDFMLPPLTMQPLIENAIRHGLNKKKGGGTLTIKSEWVEDVVRITIQDDGVGFDPAEQKTDGHSHIGIENTRNRLKALCSGSLLLESTKGVGTTATIILPHKRIL